MTINLTALQKQRRDTAANWTGANPTLLAGEIGIESDTNKIKIGDGSTAWTSLSYTTWSQISAYPIVNADVAAAAAISYSKLATLTSANIVLGSSANVATSTAVTGDVTISNTGVTAIASGVIVNADINASAAIADTKLGTISTALKVSNSATTSTDANTPSAIVARDASGNFTAGTITAALTGNASTVTTNANLTGHVTSVGNAAVLGSFTSAQLATALTDETGSGAAVFATSPTFVTPALGTPSSGTLTNCTFPTLNQNTTGNAATVTTNANLTGDITSVGNATTIAAGVIVNADVNASAAIAGTKVAPDFGSQTVITTGSGLIGTATSLTTLYSGAGKLQAASNDATTIQSYAFSSTGVDYSATLELSRARNTQASPTIVANGDYIGQINFAGYNTNFQRGATIYALVDGEPGTAGDTTDMPGKLVFATTPNGSATPTTRMSIDSAGAVTLAGTLDVPLGAAATPSITFTGDLNTGIYSPGADQLAVATNGTVRLTTSTTAISSTLPIDVPLGAVGTPSFTFTGDLNTGIYSPAADTLALVTAGNNTLHITSGGLVGIGISGPSNRLDVAGTIRSVNPTNTLNQTADVILSTNNTNFGNIATVTLQTVLNDTTSGANDFFIKQFNHNSGGSNEKVFQANSGNSGYVSLYTVNTERLRLTSTGTLNFKGVGTAGSTQAVSFDGSAPVNSLVINSSGTVGCGAPSFIRSPRLGVVGTNDLSSDQIAIAATNPGIVINCSEGGTADRGAAIIFDHGDLVAAISSSRINTNNWGTDLRFYTHPASTTSQYTLPERMRIDSEGNVLMGKTVTTFATVGVRILNDGRGQFTNSGSELLSLNRLASDGNLIDFYQDSVLEGSINVSGSTVALAGAHLSRWSQLPTGAERTEILRGSVLSNIDEMCEWGDEENEQLNRMKVSTVQGDKNVSGVFQCWDDDDDTYTNDFYCAMTGDFIIRIAEGVTIERGDLLMSAGDGTAKPQDDDIIRSKTIAKVTSTNVSCTYEDGSYCVPCVLMAC